MYFSKYIVFKILSAVKMNRDAQEIGKDIMGNIFMFFMAIIMFDLFFYSSCKGVYCEMIHFSYKDNQKEMKIGRYYSTNLS